MPADRDYEQCIELVESVMEWIGMRWTVSMIKRQLRDYFPGMSFMTCKSLIKAAGKLIRKRYNIDPQEYKGIQITFYECIIRNKHEKTKNQLAAAERLDKLFGLEQVTADDPEIQAHKIREALKEMDESFEGEDNGGQQKSNDGREGKDKKRSDDGGTVQSTGTEKTDKDICTEGSETNEESVPEDDGLSPEVLKEIGNIKDEDLKRFRKEKE